MNVGDILWDEKEIKDSKAILDMLNFKTSIKHSIETSGRKLEIRDNSKLEMMEFGESSAHKDMGLSEVA